MRLELVCTGDELLNGLATDTNSPWFASRLFLLGEQVARITVVGDVEAEIREAIAAAAARAEVVLVSGGLGPTADDLTAGCAATLAGVGLREDPRALAAMRARFAVRGLAFTPNNRKQAQVPEGAEVVLNPVGAAPMFVLTLGRATVFFVPGVPREYQALVEQEVLPRLARRLAGEPGRPARAARLLRCIGLAESHLDARIAPIALAHPKVRFGFRALAPETQLELLAEGPLPEDAERALAAAIADCRAVLGSQLFGEGEETLEQVVGRLLQARGETVSVAESCTGGLVSERLTAPAGASAHFIGGAVTYHERMKSHWAKVAPQTLAKVGAVSAEVARELAAGVRAEAQTTWGISVTGYAGPTGGTEADPVGTVYLGLAGPEVLEVERHRFTGDRDRIRHFAAATAIDLLRRHLTPG